MQKSYRKNIQRDFRSNLNRFLSLFGIVALGVMMLNTMKAKDATVAAPAEKCATQYTASGTAATIGILAFFPVV